jgi:hypothetical protein
MATKKPRRKKVTPRKRTEGEDFSFGSLGTVIVMNMKIRTQVYAWLAEGRPVYFDVPNPANAGSATSGSVSRAADRPSPNTMCPCKTNSPC